MALPAVANTRVALSVDAERDRLYLAKDGSKVVRVYELGRLEEQPSIPLREEPEDVRLLADYRANRLLVYSPPTQALQILDPDARAVIDRRTVTRNGVLDVDPVRSRIVHYSTEGLKAYDYGIRRAGDMPPVGQWISRIGVDGSAATVTPAGQGFAVRLLDLEKFSVTRNFHVPTVKGSYVNEARINVDWITLVFETSIGTTLVAIRRADGNTLRLGLPWPPAGAPVLDGNRYFMPAKDGQQNVLILVDLRERTGIRIPLGRARAFALHPGRPKLYLATEDEQLQRVDAGSGRRFEVLLGSATTLPGRFESRPTTPPLHPVLAGNSVTAYSEKINTRSR